MFALDKWYLDLVTPEGAAFVGYSASLRWHGLRLGYESFLFHPTDGPTEERTSLRRPHGPHPSRDLLVWESRALGISGTWCRAAHRRRRRLYRNGHGEVVWLCHQPRSDADVRLPGGRVLTGRGYVERLRMTMPPTELGFDTLHWGRFHSADETLVWIEWQNGAAGRWIFRNGVEQRLARLDGNAAIVLDDGAELRFGELRNLRDRHVLPALASAPGIRHRPLGRLLTMHEQKWIGQGLLRRPAADDVGGWLIHEEVTWLGVPASRAACSTAHSS